MNNERTWNPGDSPVLPPYLGDAPDWQRALAITDKRIEALSADLITEFTIRAAVLTKIAKATT